MVFSKRMLLKISLVMAWLFAMKNIILTVRQVRLGVMIEAYDAWGDVDVELGHSDHTSSHHSSSTPATRSAEMLLTRNQNRSAMDNATLSSGIAPPLQNPPPVPAPLQAVSVSLSSNWNISNIYSTSTITSASATTDDDDLTTTSSTMTTTSMSIETNNISNNNSNKPCALLFFGIVKHFEDVALPAIRKNLIAVQQQCDIYLHTYNISQAPINKRNGDSVAPKLNTSQVFLLTNNVTMDTLDEFMEKRGSFLNHSRMHYHEEWGACCTSHDNMIKQWNSIDGVWNLMRQHEQRILASSSASSSLLAGTNNNHTGTNGTYYQQVGLFRTDVYHVNPINIFDSNASVPNWAQNWGKNDRLFYGTRANAAIWADRFGFSSTFEEQYMENHTYGNPYGGYHSEYIVGSLMKHHNISVEEKPACVWRIRTRGVLKIKDCGDVEGNGNVTHLMKFAPPGYKVFDKWSGIKWRDYWHETFEGRDLNFMLPGDSKNTKQHSHNHSGEELDSSMHGIIGLGMEGVGLHTLTGLLANGYACTHKVCNEKVGYNAGDNVFGIIDGKNRTIPAHGTIVRKLEADTFDIIHSEDVHLFNKRSQISKVMNMNEENKYDDDLQLGDRVEGGYYEFGFGTIVGKHKVDIYDVYFDVSHNVSSIEGRRIRSVLNETYSSRIDHAVNQTDDDQIYDDRRPWKVGDAVSAIYRSQWQAGTIVKKYEEFFYDIRYDGSRELSLPLEMVRKKDNSTTKMQVGDDIEWLYVYKGQPSGTYTSGKIERVHASNTYHIVYDTGKEDFAVEGDKIFGVRRSFRVKTLENQNTAFLWEQDMLWHSSNIGSYNTTLALESLKRNVSPTACGADFLRALNDPIDNSPWVFTDFRMSITLRTWLPYLRSTPSVVFTYQHPVKSAFYLQKKYGIGISAGLRLWIDYNKAAIQNSIGLCRIVTSDEAIQERPLIELGRIQDELLNKCNVPRPREDPSIRRLLESFVNATGYENNIQQGENGKELGFSTTGLSVDDDYSIFTESMQIYSDQKSGKAFEVDYSWPEVVTDHNLKIDANEYNLKIHNALMYEYQKCLE